MAKKTIKEVESYIEAVGGGLVAGTVTGGPDKVAAILAKTMAEAEAKWTVEELLDLLSEGVWNAAKVAFDSFDAGNAAEANLVDDEVTAAMKAVTATKPKATKGKSKKAASVPIAPVVGTPKHKPLPEKLKAHIQAKIKATSLEQTLKFYKNELVKNTSIGAYLASVATPDKVKAIVG
jgi:hypothetical protein